MENLLKHKLEKMLIFDQKILEVAIMKYPESRILSHIARRKDVLIIECSGSKQFRIAI